MSYVVSRRSKHRKSYAFLAQEDNDSSPVTEAERSIQKLIVRTVKWFEKRE